MPHCATFVSVHGEYGGYFMELVSIISSMCMIFTVAQNCSLILGTVGNSFSGTSCNDSVILSGTVGNSWEQFVCSHK